jgi:hypothetical protein
MYKIDIKRIRTTLAIGIATILVALSCFQAEANLPLKAYTCAAYILKLNNSQSTPGGSPLYSMREFREEMGKTTSEADWSPIQFVGTFGKTENDDAQDVRRRLNGLEDDLVNPDEGLTYGVEIRGNDAVKKYVSELSELNQDVSKSSMKYINKNGGAVFRKTQVGAIAITILGVLAGVSLDPHSVLQPIIQLASYTALALGLNGVAADYFRAPEVEVQSNGYLRAVNKAIEKKMSQKLLFFSGNFNLPEDMFSNVKKSYDKKLFLEQALEHHILDSPMPDVSTMTLYFLKMARQGDTSVFFSERPPKKDILIDQMFYFDPNTSEPVLVTYIREKKNGLPRPAPRQKRNEKKDLNFDWLGKLSGSDLGFSLEN